jgi:hypothetical protein
LGGRVHTAVLGIAFLLLPAGASGQAWVQEKDGYYFKASGTYLYTTEQFDYQGNRQPIFSEDSTRTDASFREVTISTYLEYGLSDRFTLVATLPFKILTARDTQVIPGEPVRDVSPTNGGLADLWLSLRTPIAQGGFAASVQAGVKLPLGYEKDPDNQGPPLGTGEVDAEAHLLVGQSLWPIPAYLGASGGYRVRGGAFHDEILFSAEGGYTAGDFFVKIRFDGLVNVEEPPNLELVNMIVANGGSAVVGDQDIFKLSPTVEYRVNEGFAIGADAFHTFAGKNTVTGTTWSLALVWSR